MLGKKIAFAIVFLYLCMYYCTQNSCITGYSGSCTLTLEITVCHVMKLAVAESDPDEGILTKHFALGQALRLDSIRCL